MPNRFGDSELPETPTVNRFGDSDVPQSAQVDDYFKAPADLEIRAYNPTFLDRTRNFIQPLTDIITKLATPPEAMPQIPRVPEGVFAAFGQPGQVAEGVVNTASGLINSAPTPVGLALAMGGAPAKIAGGLLAPVMAQHAADQAVPTAKVLMDPNASVGQKTEAALGEGLSALGAVAPLAGLRRGPLTEPVQPNFETMKNVTPPKPLALPEGLATRVAEKTPEQAVKAIREEIKLTEDPAKKAKLVDEADRLEREIAARDASAERQQQVLDAQDAQIKIIEDQQKAVENQQKAEQKARENAQKLAIEEAKARGEQTQAIMEANTPPPELQAQKPQVLANTAAISAKAIENNPENAQAQLNALTQTQTPQPNALQVQGPNAQMLRQPEAQPQNPLAVPGVGNGNAQSQVPAGAEAQTLKPIPKDVKIEYLGKKPLAMEGGPAVDQWQVQLPGEKRGLTVTADIIRQFGYEPPETIVSAAIKSKDGEVFTGRIHALAMEAAQGAGKEIGAKESDEGFITSTGRFVSRSEAGQLAKSAGQMEVKSPIPLAEFMKMPKGDANAQPTQAQGSTGQTAAEPRMANPATDIPLPDNLENRRKGAQRRQQRGGIDADTMGTVAGSAGSGLYGFVSTHKRDDETEEEFQIRRALRTIAFATGGGFAGGGAVRLLGKSAPVRNAELLAKIQNEARGVDSVPKWYQELRQTPAMVKFREALNNSRAIVKDVVGNATQEGVTVMDQANPYATGKTYAAKVSEAQRKAKVVMDGLQAGVIEAAKASGMKPDDFINRFNIWMEARHTPDYNKHLADLHKANGGVGTPPTSRLTDQEALQVRIDASKDGLDLPFIQLMKGYNGVIESIRDLLEQGGLITPETRKAWVQKFPNYVPMNRILPDEDVDSAIIGHLGGGPGLSVLGSGVRKIKGSNLDVSDIAGNLMANWNDAITRVEKNEVAKSAGYFFKNLDFEGKPYPGVEVRSPKVIGTSGDKPIYEPFKPENMVSYMVKGRPQWIVFKDPRMATAFSNLNPESQNRLMRYIATPTRILSRAFTGFNLDFLVPNIVRDRQSAAWKALSQGDIEGALQQINPARMGGDPAIVAQWVSGKQTPETQLFQQMMDDGGMPGGYASSTRAKAQDFIESLRRADTNPASWTLQKTKDAFNFLSEISEGSTRYRAYKRALDLGASRQEAAVQALNSSIDFNQKGTASPSFGAFYAFFNPAAQGGVNAAKNLLRSKDGMAVLLAGLVGLGAAVDAWNKSFDPDWKKRKAFAYARTNGIPLIYGSDDQTKEFKYFTLPLSQELRPVKAVADFANEMSNGDIKSGDNLQDELGRVGGAIAAASNPLGASPIDHPLTTIIPTVARPLLEIASNRDYADRPIIPDRLHDSPLVQRQAQRNLQTYDNRTGRMAIALADLLKKDFNLEVSPEHMKYLVNFYGGGPVRLVSSIINFVKSEETGFKASDLPVVGSFMRRASNDNLEKVTPLYKQTQEQLSDAKTAGELALQQSKLFFKHTFDKMEPKDWIPFWREADAQGLIPKDMVFRKQILTDMADKIKGRGDVDKLVAQFSVDNGERATYYVSRKKDFKTPAEFNEFLQDQAKKGLITPPMIPQMVELMKQQK